MKKWIYVFSIVIISFFSLSTFAEIYRSVDSEGVVTYSDQPNVGAEAVTLPAANIAKQPEKPATETTSATTKTETTETSENKKTEKTPEKKIEYATFTMSSPKDQETFQNQTEIHASVTIDPALQSGDLIQFYLDDLAVGKPSNKTTLTIQRSINNQEILTRGSHTIYAVILNAEGDTISTTPAVTVFVHYATVKQQK